MLLIHKTEFKLIVNLTLKGIEHKTAMLGIGDAIVSQRTGVERKGSCYTKKGEYSHDFVASIKDQRIFIQCQDLSENFERPIMIIEDYENIFLDKSVEESSIKSMMAEISVRWGICIIPTRNVYETVDVLIKLSEYDAKDGYYISTNVHPKPKSDYDSQIYLVTGLIGVELKKAKILLDELDTPLKIFKAIDQAEYRIPKRGKNKKLVGIFAKMKGFGPKFVDKNKILLNKSAKIKD